MRILRESSLHDYARSFWDRERQNNPNGKRVWEDIITRGADPVQLLARPEEQGGYPYKLPRSENGVVNIALLENREEVEPLLVHRCMPHDSWMRERCLEPVANTRKLGDLANVFIERGYFERADSDGTQVNCYREWKTKSTLKDVITGDRIPLVEQNCHRRAEYAPK